MPIASRALAILLSLVPLVSCASGGGVPRPFPGAPSPPAATVVRPVDEAPATSPTAPSSEVVARLVSIALEYRGVPYLNGGSDPEGFDCSGFVQYVFGRLGIAMPREVRDQFKAGRHLSLDEMTAGDLIFFQTVTPGASHVGVVVGPGEFVHAPSSRGVVRVERYTLPYWERRLVGVRRIL